MSETVADNLTALRASDDLMTVRARDDLTAHRASAICADPTAAGMPANRHLPERPGWHCVVDGKPWPCPGARIHLRSQFVDDRVGLAVYMSTQLMTAAVDITNDDALPPDLFNRFMSWT